MATLMMKSSRSSQGLLLLSLLLLAFSAIPALISGDFTNQSSSFFYLYCRFTACFLVSFLKEEKEKLNTA